MRKIKRQMLVSLFPKRVIKHVLQHELEIRYMDCYNESWNHLYYQMFLSVVFGVLLLARYCLTAYMLPDSNTTTSTRPPTAY